MYGEVLSCAPACVLARTPAPETVRLYVNGQRWARGIDYTIEGKTITPVQANWAAVEAGAVIVCDYDY